MARYASNTNVSEDRSRVEIERSLMRYGASQFAYARSHAEAMIGFAVHGYMVRMRMPMPTYSEFSTTDAGHSRRSRDAQDRAYDQAIRQRYRALALVVKAKLEAIEAGITAFEDEFGSFISLPSGETVGEWLRPQLAHAVATGTMPNHILPMLGTGSKEDGNIT